MWRIFKEIYRKMQCNLKICLSIEHAKCYQILDNSENEKQFEETHKCALAALSLTWTNISRSWSTSQKDSPCARFTRTISGDAFSSMHCANSSCTETQSFIFGSNKWNQNFNRFEDIQQTFLKRQMSSTLKSDNKSRPFLFFKKCKVQNRRFFLIFYFLLQ
jgi:hypothetical protein